MDNIFFFYQALQFCTMLWILCLVGKSFVTFDCRRNWWIFIKFMYFSWQITWKLQWHQIGKMECVICPVMSRRWLWTVFVNFLHMDILMRRSYDWTFQSEAYKRNFTISTLTVIFVCIWMRIPFNWETLQLALG